MLMHAAIPGSLIHPGKISVKIISAFAAAAVTAGIVSLQNSPLQAEAYSRPQAVEKINIAPPVAKCSQQAWPYYESSCLRVGDKSVGEARTVRFIPIDRRQTPTQSH